MNGRLTVTLSRVDISAKEASQQLLVDCSLVATLQSPLKDEDLVIGGDDERAFTVFMMLQTEAHHRQEPPRSHGAVRSGVPVVHFATAMLHDILNSTPNATSRAQCTCVMQPVRDSDYRPPPSGQQLAAMRRVSQPAAVYGARKTSIESDTIGGKLRPSSASVAETLNTLGRSITIRKFSGAVLVPMPLAAASMASVVVSGVVLRGVSAANGTPFVPVVVNEGVGDMTPPELLSLRAAFPSALSGRSAVGPGKMFEPAGSSAFGDNPAQGVSSSLGFVCRVPLHASRNDNSSQSQLVRSLTQLRSFMALGAGVPSMRGSRVPVLCPLHYHPQARLARGFLSKEHCEKLQERYHIMSVSASSADKVCSSVAARLQIPLELNGGMYQAKTQWFISALSDAMLLTSMFQKQVKDVQHDAQRKGDGQRRACFVTPSSAQENSLAFFLEPRRVLDALLQCCRAPEAMLQSHFYHDIPESVLISEMGAASAAKAAAPLAAVQRPTPSDASPQQRRASVAAPSGNVATITSSHGGTHFTVEWFDFALLSAIGCSGWERVLFPLIERYYTYPPLISAMRSFGAVSVANACYRTIDDVRDHLLYVAAALRPHGMRTEDYHSFLDRAFPPFAYSGVTAAGGGNKAASSRNLVALQRDGSTVSSRSVSSATNAATCGQSSAYLFPLWLRCFHRMSGRSAAKLGGLAPWEIMSELHVSPARMLWAMFPSSQVEMLLDVSSREHVYLTTQRRAGRNTRLAMTAAATMCAHHEHHLMQRYLHRWIVYQRQRREFLRKRMALATTLQRKSDARVLSAAMLTWRAFWSRQRSQRKSRNSVHCLDLAPPLTVLTHRTLSPLLQSL